MTKHTLLAVLVAGLLLAFPTHPARGDDNLATVIVEGQGIDKDDAIRDGLRKAVEKAAGTFIYSQSEVKDYVLIRDTILARAAGFVQSHEVVSMTEKDGIYTAKLQCVVSRKGIEDTWGVVKSLLTAMGRPKIMVIITEKVDQVTSTGRAGVRTDKQVVQDKSTVQTQIEGLLLANGFDLVDSEQIEKIKKTDLQAAIAENDPAKAAAIAKKFGAQLFIKGEVNAAAGLPTVVGGVYLYTYEAAANLKCYRTDTAQLMSSRGAPIPAPRGAGRVWRSAADMSLAALGKEVAPAIQNDILRFWLDATTGGGEVKLEISDISLRDVVRIKNALAEVKGVKEVNYDYSNRIVVFRLQTTESAKKIAELLIDVQVGSKILDVTGISQNVIKAKLANEES